MKHPIFLAHGHGIDAVVRGPSGDLGQPGLDGVVVSDDGYVPTLTSADYGLEVLGDGQAGAVMPVDHCAALDLVRELRSE